MVRDRIAFFVLEIYVCVQQSAKQNMQNCKDHAPACIQHYYVLSIGMEAHYSLSQAPNWWPHYWAIQKNWWISRSWSNKMPRIHSVPSFIIAAPNDIDVVV